MDKLINSGDTLEQFFMSNSQTIPLLWYADNKYWLSDHACYVKWRIGWRVGDIEPKFMTYEALLHELRYPKHGRRINVLSAKDDRRFDFRLSDSMLNYNIIAAAAAMLGFPVALNIINSDLSYISELLLEPDIVIIKIRDRALVCHIEADEMVVNTVRNKISGTRTTGVGFCVARIPLYDAIAFNKFGDKLRKLDQTSKNILTDPFQPIYATPNDSIGYQTYM